MSKKAGIILIIVTALSLCLAITGVSIAAVSLGLVASDIAAEKEEKAAQEKEAEALTMQYVMYVGTNDKDTYVPVCTPDEAIAIVDGICLKYFDGYTLQEAKGSWLDELDNATHEYTVVCYFDGAEEAKVYQAADEILVALNQSTILIEKNHINIDYYTGSNN